MLPILFALGEWDRNRSFVRIRFRRPTQPLRLARQSKDN